MRYARHRRIVWKRSEVTRKGQYSIRVNDQFRLCFTWHAGDAFDVEIVDYH